jgi:hypothetical protein
MPAVFIENERGLPSAHFKLMSQNKEMCDEIQWRKRGPTRDQHVNADGRSLGHGGSELILGNGRRRRHLHHDLRQTPSKESDCNPVHDCKARSREHG